MFLLVIHSLIVVFFVEQVIHKQYLHIGNIKLTMTVNNPTGKNGYPSRALIMPHHDRLVVDYYLISAH